MSSQAMATAYIDRLQGESAPRKRLILLVLLVGVSSLHSIAFSPTRYKLLNKIQDLYPHKITRDGQKKYEEIGRQFRFHDENVWAVLLFSLDFHVTF